MQGDTGEAVAVDMQQIALREGLEFLARSATKSLLNLETICTGVWSLSTEFSYSSEIRSTLDGMLCDAY